MTLLASARCSIGTFLTMAFLAQFALEAASV
jgi:hypothetical protein